MTENKARFGKWLDLLLAMTDGRNHTVKELAQVLGTTTRNLYYTLNVLSDYGFVVVHENLYYYLDPRSPFFQEIAKTVDFTETEALYIHGLLSAVNDSNAMVGLLRRKVERNYGLRLFMDIKFQHQVYSNQSQLEVAIKQRRCVILHNYSSPHSHSVSDRVIEPFMFLGDKSDIRAYELKSHQNKTFKVSRIGTVEVVDTPWINTSKHKEVYTDMYMFSGEEKHHVKLRFSLLAHRIMLEEYPHSKSLMTQDDSTHWIFEADLVSYIGISRFVLGLFSDIEILEDDGLRQFLRQKISAMSVP